MEKLSTSITTLNDNNIDKRCLFHQVPYTFFCFDDREFVCNDCYKKHRGHKLEIKQDIEEKLKSLETLKKSNVVKILDQYASYRNNLEDIKLQIEKEITETNDTIFKLKGDEAVASDKLSGSIFELSFAEYENIENVIEKKKNILVLWKKIKEILYQMMNNFGNDENKLSYEKLHWIQKEIDIIDHSAYHPGFPPFIILNQSSGDYYLSEGNRNHSLTFDFRTEYYVKGFKIKISDFDCTLKNFIVSVKKDNGFVILQRYQCQKYNSQIEWYEFQLDTPGRIFRFDLIDNWGESGGDYILIKTLMFNVGTIINELP